MSSLRQSWKPALAAALLLTAGYLLIRRPATAVTPPTPGGAEPTAPTGQRPTASVGDERTYEIVTLLPRDAIPAIDNPRFYSAAEADAEYGPAELVLGVSLDGDSRAYSTSLLSRHEIVNDTVGGRPIAVTW